jgi:branched-chain amino acid transport system substrate-binding protein
MSTRSRRWRARSLVGTTMATVLFLSACGSSSKSAGVTSTTASSSTGNVVQANKSPILIAALLDITGPSAGSEASLAKVVPAWVKYINARGGINGHPVTVDIGDTHSDAPTTLTLAQQLLAKKPVAWLLGSVATETSVAQFLGRTDIPIVGDGFSPAVWGAKLTSLNVNCSSAANASLPCALPNAFTVTTTFGAVLDQAVIEAKAAGATKIVDVVCAEIDSCSSGDPEFAATAKLVGIADAGLIKVSSTAANYTSQCIELIQEHVGWAEVSADTPVIEKMWNDCEAQGFTGRFGDITGSASGQILKVPGIRLGGGFEAFPWWVNDAPVKEFRDAMAASGVGPADYSNSTATGIWTALQMFAAAQKNLSTNPTAAETLANMYTLHDETLGGLIPPITFTKGQPAGPRNCFWPYIFDNGVISNPLGGLHYECYPAA